MDARLNVLILEDSPDDAELMISQLAREGFDIQWQRVEREDAYLAQLNSEIDIILADFTLPQYNAIEALKALKSRRDLTVPFIIVSGSIGEEIAVQAMREGADDYLLKDRLSRLGQSVKLALDKKRLKEEKEHSDRLLRESERRYRKRAHEYAALYEAAHAFSEQRHLNDLLDTAIEQATKLMEVDSGWIFLWDANTNALELVALKGLALTPATHFQMGEDIIGWVAENQGPLIIDDYHNWKGQTSEFAGLPIKAIIAVPLMYSKELLGVLAVAGDGDGKNQFNQSDLSLLSTLAEIASNGFIRLRLHDQTERRLQQLAALRAIDMAITSSLDLRVTLNVLLDQVTSQLGVDATDILLLSQHNHALKYAAGRGFRADSITSAQVRIGEGHAGRAVLTRKKVSIPDFDHGGENFLRTRPLAEEGFKSYYCSPLIAKGKVKGLLEVFHRSPLPENPEWIEFMEMLASQAAIAIDNAELFEQLQSSNTDLMLAYDTTLEGWVKAIDLRDKETEGHTQRVTEMTIRLAKASGISEYELVDIRRGALLHDIGKMGIPDKILRKPGPLTREEWEIMHTHPVHAYEWLAPIPFLRKAVDIPYCHHEKWNGSGYPQGLRGDQIPMAARVFAVIDVWDALTSDRPYRTAWSREKALNYIDNQAGEHFDPSVVNTFFKTIMN